MLLTWKELSSGECRSLAGESVAALVIGSCEQHGLHLPVGTDVYLGEAVLERAAEYTGRKIVMLPSLSYGFSAHHMDFAGSITLTQNTLATMVQEIVLGAAASGFSDFVLVVSHGGNSPAVHMAVNELGIAMPECRVAMLKYWDFMKDFITGLRGSPLGGIGHAGEMETSMMMALHPELVGEGWEKYTLAEGDEWYHPDMFADSRITVYKSFRDISPYGNVGICEYASGEKGGKIMDHLGKEIGNFLEHYFD